MQIGHHDIAEKVLIIAEIGNNHEGDYTLAKEMIAAAAESGADAVKFQTIVPERLVSATDTERVEQLRRFQLTHRQFEGLAQCAAENGVMFLSTPFHLDAVGWLDELVPAFKIASSDNTFWPLLDRVAATGKPVLLSTGLAGLGDVTAAVECLRVAWRKLSIRGELALLHCVSAYPTPPEEAHLSAITTLAQQFNTFVGYSDHTLGIDACILAVALGARILEKHFTLDKQQSDFHDHQLSADPEDLKQLVVHCRAAEVLLGSDAIAVQTVESPNTSRWRRSIVASRKLFAGQVIHPEDLEWVRPGTGLAPGREGELVGRVLQRDIAHGECIQLTDIGVHPGLIDLNSEV